MSRPRWRKVIKDLWGNKVRSLLVVLSIAIGVFAIGMIVGTQVMLQEDLSASYAATNPASATLYLDDFDDDLLFTIRKVDGVREAEARREVGIRLQTGPDEWQNINLDIIANYNDIRLNQISPVTGDWPPPYKTLLLERASLEAANAQVGDIVMMEDANGKLRQMTVTGLVHDLNKPPVQFTGEPLGYITLDTLEWLGFSRQFDQLNILVEGDTTDSAHIQQIADLVEEKVEKSGRSVYFTWIPEPGQHPANDVVQPLLLILGVLGALSLFASSFLVINIINGLLAQHTTQIGIMKAIGAQTSQIMQMYLVLVVVFGLMSLVVAVPLGGLAAYGLTGYLASLINFDLAGFRIPLLALWVMTAVGIIVPLVAALYPVVRGVGISVREAFSEYGLGQGQFGSSTLDRLVNWLTSTVLSLSRPMRISLRNSIRRKARLIFTLFTLTLGGSIFIGVLSVHASLLATLDEALAYFNYDVDVNFSQPHRIEELQREALQIPGVVEADSWLGSAGRRQRPNGSEGDNVFILGTEPDTNFINPILLEGRWLQPADENAIVLNSLVTRDETDVQLGDTITLNIDSRDSEWQVVGIVQGVMTGPIGYVNRPYFERFLRSVGRSSGIQIIAAQHDEAFQTDLARRVRQHFDNAGLTVNATHTTAETRQTIEYQFNILITFLVIMAVLIAAVGGLGLMGTMSINVLERTREIGVMRAVGASDSSILRIVLVEGIFVGIISWLLGGVAAYPIGKLLSNTVGIAFMESPLTYVFSTPGAIGWLAAMLIIATLASYLPARNASNLSVRETLAYE
jgi:putative ABC transport system permease protein